MTPHNNQDAETSNPMDYRSKKRQYPSGEQNTIPNAYRLHFSCDYAGKYIRATKRKLTWRFGFTNLAAAKEGKSGSDCRGEEHEIILIWSVKSGKTKVFWNKNNISHLFPASDQFDRVRLCWESRSGEKFEIIAHANPIESGSQYDLTIGRSEFFGLPHVSELRGMDFKEEACNLDVEVADDESVIDSAKNSSSEMTREEPPISLGFRLSMAGFTPPQTSDNIDELEDELTSDLFTNTLESLRHRVIEILPNAEDMVSRAIINAFSEDRDSLSSAESTSCDSAPTCASIEADSVWEAVSWVALNVACAPCSDIEEQKRGFMQKQLDSIFLNVRNDILTEDAASRVIRSVATVLGLPLNESIPEDTILLDELDKNVDADDLIDALCVFGEVKEAAISRGRRFGICRFYTENGMAKAIAASSSGSIVIHGKKPTIKVLSRPHVLTVERPPIARRAVSEPNARLAKPTLARKRSHQRNTITIDTVLTQAPFLGLVHDTPLVTPDSTRTLLRPNVFTNIPARSTPMVFDAAVVSPETSRYSPTSMVVKE